MKKFFEKYSPALYLHPGVLRSFMLHPILFVLVSSWVGPPPQNNSSDIIPLATAIEQGLVEVEFSKRQGVWEHFGECMEVRVTNNSEKMLRTALNTGWVLHSDEGDVQDMLITEDRLMAIRPGYEKTYPLFAMCCQNENSAPGKSDDFSLSFTENEKLAGIAELIARYDYHDYCGQRAVWAISDNRAISTIVSDDPEQMRRLRTYVARTRNQEYVEELSTPERVVIEMPKPPRDQNKLLKGTLSYILDETSIVTAGIYDSRDSLVNTFADNRRQVRGQHIFEFEISSSRMTTGPYRAAVRTTTRGEIASVPLELRLDLNPPTE